MYLAKKGIIALLAAALGASGFVHPATAAETTSAPLITGQAYIGDAGKMVQSFDIKVSDPSRYTNLQADDFDITGNYDGYPLNDKGEVVQNNYSDDEIRVSMQDKTIHLDFKPFRYDGGSVEKFAVKSTRFPELSFTADNVSQLAIRTVDDFKPGVLTSDSGDTLPYRLKLSSSSGAQPLVVWLHGGGEVGSDNMKQLTENRGATVWTESGRDASVLAVHYPQNYDWAIYDKPEQLQKMQTYFTMQATFIKQLVAEGKVDPERIYVAGVSSGGGGAFRFLMQYPDLFAGGIVIAAKDTVADYKGSVDAFKTALKPLVHTPIWIFHAENDPITDSRTSKLAYQALTELGSTQAKETIYSNSFMDSQRLYGAMKHWSWVPALNDPNTVNWLFAQHKDNSAGSAQPQPETTSDVDDGTPITRAELAGLLVKTFDYAVPANSQNQYRDIANTTLAPAIQAVTAAGLMRGVGNDTFAPDMPVTRAQLAVIVNDWLKLYSGSEQSTSSAATGYTDVPQQHWAYAATMAVQPLKLLPMDTADQLNPTKSVSMTEAVKLVGALMTYPSDPKSN